MSDFVTELRREVVTAHAQHRAAAVRTRRRRRRPLLAGAAALAALLVAVVLIARSLPAPEQTAEPRVVEVVRIGGTPADGVLALGSLWVAEFDGRRVVRIDPETREVTARIPLGDQPEVMASAGERLWAAGQTPDGYARVWSIDPEANTVRGQFETDEGADVTATGDAVWVTRRGHEDHSIDRFSATDLRRVGRIPFGGPIGLAVGGDSVWAFGSDGTIARIDAGSGRIAHRWPRLMPSNLTASGRSIAADRTGAWVLDSYGGQIVRLEGDRIVRTIRIGESKPILAATPGALWIVTGDDPTASRIARIDPRNGRETASVELGTHYPRALVPAPDGLWVVAGDGTVVLVAG